ncbi:acyl--CoA ligase (plasmid) [Halobaculum sp. CBA1158]|uniref:class I adenylate-forming enzyme family protein n=1 Tax=Halobaculum sp. CBA1158 TaxID=2904243 RepID=UPI001F1667A6|nr:class I adenylate-forming enzyme family protein [Halobaculum sp. CBA1158]UIP01485.1 acyl--CoA ligase [Halobaculum sp. CBA1158]
MKFLDAFRRSVRCHGSETAVMTDDGRTFSYDELDERTTRLVNAVESRVNDGPLASLGVNGPEMIESMIVGHKRGTPTVQLPFRAKAGELVRMCEAADAEALLFDDANVQTARAMLDRGEFEFAVHAGEADVDIEGVVDYEDLLAAAAADSDPGLPADGDASVFYTSGTTSLPKAVPFDGEQLWYGAIQGVMEHGIDHTDVGVMTTPWYHMVSSDAWIYPHLLAGATVLVQSDFDPAAALSLVEEANATGLLAVPTQLTAMNDVAADGDYDTDSLTYVRTGGSVVSEQLVERTHEHLSEELYNTYGMTEAGPNLSYAHPEDQEGHYGTIGKEAHTYELRVVETAPITEDPDPEATVDAGEQGEIIARGPGMARGYIDNPEAEEKSFFDGWLRTRDVAEVDEDGYLYIVDRVDNMFQSGGENVYPVEVEHALENHEAVDEAFVYGVDDDHWGKVVSAVVVVADADVTGDDLDEFCREETDLANFKRPRNYTVRSESASIPRTSTGKIKRDAVLDEIEE